MNREKLFSTIKAKDEEVALQQKEKLRKAADRQAFVDKYYRPLSDRNNANLLALANLTGATSVLSTPKGEHTPSRSTIVHLGAYDDGATLSARLDYISPPHITGAAWIHFERNGDHIMTEELYGVDVDSVTGQGKCQIIKYGEDEFDHPEEQHETRKTHLGVTDNVKAVEESLAMIIEAAKNPELNPHLTHLFTEEASPTN